MAEVKQQSKEAQALYLLDTILAQWLLLEKDDTIITLCLKKGTGVWGIVEARRMTFTDGDVAILNSIGKNEQGKKLSLNEPADYVG